MPMRTKSSASVEPTSFQSWLSMPRQKRAITSSVIPPSYPIRPPFPSYLALSSDRPGPEQEQRQAEDRGVDGEAERADGDRAQAAAVVEGLAHGDHHRGEHPEPADEEDGRRERLVEREGEQHARRARVAERAQELARVGLRLGPGEQARPDPPGGARPGVPADEPADGAQRDPAEAPVVEAPDPRGDGDEQHHGEGLRRRAPVRLDLLVERRLEARRAPHAARDRARAHWTAPSAFTQRRQRSRVRGRVVRVIASSTKSGIASLTSTVVERRPSVWASSIA